MNTPIYADLDQIVFEGRSKEYGAFEMRRRYNRVLTRAMLIAFLLFISITALPKMIEWIRPDEMAVMAPEDEMIPTIGEFPIPPKPEPPVEKVELPAAPAAPDVRTIAVHVPNPTPEDLLRDDATIADLSKLDSAAVGKKDHEGPIGDLYPWDSLKTPCPTCPPAEDIVVVQEPLEPSSTTFVLLEKEPQPVNMEELKSLIGYPKMAVEAEIEGKVVMRVMVDSHGDYVKHIVLRSPHPILTNAVESKINHLKMTPGIQAGKPIKVWVTLPFDFHLLK